MYWNKLKLRREDAGREKDGWKEEERKVVGTGHEGEWKKEWMDDGQTIDS